MLHTMDTLLALQPSHDSSVAQRCGATWMEICNGKHATLVSSWGHTRLSWLGYLLPVWWHQSHHNDFCRKCFFTRFFFEWACSKQYTYHGEYSLHHFHLQMVAGSLFEPWFFSVCNVRLCFRPTPQGLGCVRRDGAYRERMNAMLASESSLQVRNFLSLVVFYMYKWSQSNLHLCHGWTMPSSTSLNTSCGSLGLSGSSYFLTTYSYKSKFIHQNLNVLMVFNILHPNLKTWVNETSSPGTCCTIFHSLAWK